MEDVNKIMEDLKNGVMPKEGMGFNLEFMPPLVSDGIERVIGISVNYKNKTISVSYSECKERFGEDRYKSPNYYKNECITFPIQMLSWLGPRLDGYRHFLGVENSYEKHGGK